MLLPLILTLAASQTTVTLIATDSKSVSSGTMEDFNDNTLRALWNNSTQGNVDGLIKFDLSSIPNKSSISSMSLRLYHMGGSGSPYNNPTVQVWRSITDSWARGQNDIHPEMSVVLSTVQSAIPVNDLDPMDIPLNSFAVNWTPDLLDNLLTLVVTDTAGAVGRDSYAYFYGSDAGGAPPELTLTYSGNPGLSVYNLRHNVIAVFNVYNAKIGANCAVFASRTGPGPGTVTGGTCGQVPVSLTPRIYKLGTAVANGQGTATITFTVPIGAGGSTVWIQGVDYGVCKTTDLFTGVVG